MTIHLLYKVVEPNLLDTSLNISNCVKDLIMNYRKILAP